MREKDIHIIIDYSRRPKPLWMGDSPQDKDELCSGYVDLTGDLDKEGTDQVIKEERENSLL